MVLVWFKIFFFTFFKIHASIAAIEEKTFPFVRTTGKPSSLTSRFVAPSSLSFRYSVISFQPFKMGVVNSSLLNGYFEHDSDLHYTDNFLGRGNRPFSQRTLWHTSTREANISGSATLSDLHYTDNFLGRGNRPLQKSLRVTSVNAARQTRPTVVFRLKNIFKNMKKRLDKLPMIGI